MTDFGPQLTAKTRHLTWPAAHYHGSLITAGTRREGGRGHTGATVAAPHVAIWQQDGELAPLTDARRKGVFGAAFSRIRPRIVVAESLERPAGVTLCADCRRSSDG
jgi:hypothetical protein